MLFGLESEMDFGKHKGKKLQEVIDLGPEGCQYLLWANDNVKGFSIHKSLKEKCKSEMYKSNYKCGDEPLNADMMSCHL